MADALVWTFGLGFRDRDPHFKRLSPRLNPKSLLNPYKSPNTDKSKAERNSKKPKAKRNSKKPKAL